ncbi:MAG: 3-isopropylmalate dehydratase large subunit [Armatimonadota bacterium]|nr:MAG: 3-isopropylmalate dehydratase large subunit [Armatimonadota bacterium]
MGATITEKILAAHSGQQTVRPGQFVMAELDLMLGNDVTAPIAIEEFRKIGAKKLAGGARLVLVADHGTPNKDIKTAEQCRVMREFSREQGVQHFYDVGRAGIEHALLPEEGLVAPGECIIGADSHTCTYGAVGAFATGTGSTDLAVAMATGQCWLRVPESIKVVYRGERKPWVGGKDLILYTIGRISVSGALYQALEFCGEAIEALPMADRLTMCNMAIEAGAKNGIIAPDATTASFMDSVTSRDYRPMASDADAEYARTIEIDCSEIELQVALPALPEKARPVGEVGEVTIQQAVIGSCTNGRIEDMRAAAEILRGRKVHPEVRLIVIPATPRVQLEMVREGLAETFLEAGGVLSTPTCGPCLGYHMGVLAKGERAVATTNRNFVGRMGHQESEVYLAGPPVAAASAVLGRIGSPEELP